MRALSVTKRRIHRDKMRKLWNAPGLLNPMQPEARRLTSTIIVEDLANLDNVVALLTDLGFAIDHQAWRDPDVLQVYLVTRLGDEDYLIRLMETVDPFDVLLAERSEQ
jgi:hypothetical protein